MGKDLNKIKFRHGDLQQFNSLETLDPTTLYRIDDTRGAPLVTYGDTVLSNNDLLPKTYNLDDFKTEEQITDFFENIYLKKSDSSYVTINNWLNQEEQIADDFYNAINRSYLKSFQFFPTQILNFYNEKPIAWLNFGGFEYGDRVLEFSVDVYGNGDKRLYTYYVKFNYSTKELWINDDIVDINDNVISKIWNRSEWHAYVILSDINFSIEKLYKIYNYFGINQITFLGSLLSSAFSYDSFRLQLYNALKYDYACFPYETVDERHEDFLIFKGKGEDLGGK